MLGFRARARTFDIRIDPEELEDAALAHPGRAARPGAPPRPPAEP